MILEVKKEDFEEGFKTQDLYNLAKANQEEFQKLINEMEKFTQEKLNNIRPGAGDDFINKISEVKCDLIIYSNEDSRIYKNAGGHCYVKGNGIDESFRPYIGIKEDVVSKFYSNDLFDNKSAIGTTVHELFHAFSTQLYYLSSLKDRTNDHIRATGEEENLMYTTGVMVNHKSLGKDDEWTSYITARGINEGITEMLTQEFCQKKMGLEVDLAQTYLPCTNAAKMISSITNELPILSYFENGFSDLAETLNEPFAQKAPKRMAALQMINKLDATNMTRFQNLDEVLQKNSEIDIYKDEAYTFMGISYFFNYKMKEKIENKEISFEDYLKQVKSFEEKIYSSMTMVNKGPCRKDFWEQKENLLDEWNIVKDELRMFAVEKILGFEKQEDIQNRAQVLKILEKNYSHKIDTGFKDIKYNSVNLGENEVLMIYDEGQANLYSRLVSEEKLDYERLMIDPDIVEDGFDVGSEQLSEQLAQNFETNQADLIKDKLSEYAKEGETPNILYSPRHEDTIFIDYLNDQCKVLKLLEDETGINLKEIDTGQLQSFEQFLKPREETKDKDELKEIPIYEKPTKKTLQQRVAEKISRQKINILEQLAIPEKIEKLKKRDKDRDTPKMYPFKFKKKVMFFNLNE